MTDSKTGLSVVADQETFEIFDFADEAQVLSEISGRVVDKYIYSFEQGGERIEGLSYSGVNWACREYAKHGEAIRVMGKPDIIIDPMNSEYIIAVVMSQRFAISPESGREVALDSAIGVKRQWSKFKRRDGSVSPDPFYVEKAVSKAARNAKAALLPTHFVREMIKLAKAPARGAKPERPAEGSSTRQAPPRHEPYTEAPMVAPDEEAQRPTPAKAPEKPAAPPAAEKPAGDNTAERQKLYILLKKLIPGDGEAKKALQDTMQVGSSKDLSSEQVMTFTKAIVACLNKTYKIVKAKDGKYEVLETASGKRILPPGVDAGPEAPQEADGSKEEEALF